MRGPGPASSRRPDGLGARAPQPVSPPLKDARRGDLVEVRLNEGEKVLVEEVPVKIPSQRCDEPPTRPPRRSRAGDPAPSVSPGPSMSESDEPVAEGWRAASSCSRCAGSGPWRIEPGDEDAADPLEFLIVLDALESDAAPGLSQLLAEQGQGRCREGAHAVQAGHDVVGRRGASVSRQLEHALADRRLAHRSRPRDCPDTAMPRHLGLDTHEQSPLPPVQMWEQHSELHSELAADLILDALPRQRAPEREATPW